MSLSPFVDVDVGIKQSRVSFTFSLSHRALNQRFLRDVGRQRQQQRLEESTSSLQASRQLRNLRKGKGEM
jgi:hypothetical protein